MSKDISNQRKLGKGLDEMTQELDVNWEEARRQLDEMTEEELGMSSDIGQLIRGPVERIVAKGKSMKVWRSEEGFHYIDRLPARLTLVFDGEHRELYEMPRGFEPNQEPIRWVGHTVSSIVHGQRGGLL